MENARTRNYNDGITLHGENKDIVIRLFPDCLVIGAMNDTGTISLNTARFLHMLEKIGPQCIKISKMADGTIHMVEIYHTKYSPCLCK